MKCLSIRRAATLIATAILIAAPVQANDSEAEIGIGGIVLKSSAVRLDSEDLFISESRVTVDYRFTNPTEQGIATTVAFPMPLQPRGMGDQYMYFDGIEPWDGFGFATYVDGAPVRLQQVDRAMIGDEDVTERIEALGWPLHWFHDDAFLNTLRAMSQDAAANPYAVEGLLTEDEYYPGELVPAWDVATYFVRNQYFPAGETIAVRHEYVPIAGGSIGGALAPAVRAEMPEMMADYRDRWCVDKAFLAGLDKRLAASNDEEPWGIYGETWLSYMLSPGSNWAGPIGTFRLVVDKGSPDNLVSFCMDGVKKISPTAFEVQKTNFEPARDLDILILKFWNE